MKTIRLFFIKRKIRASLDKVLNQLDHYRRYDLKRRLISKHLNFFHVDHCLLHHLGKVIYGECFSYQADRDILLDYLELDLGNPIFEAYYTKEEQLWTEHPELTKEILFKKLGIKTTTNEQQSKPTINKHTPMWQV